MNTSAKLLLWSISIFVVGCSASFILITKPKKSVDIEIHQNSSIDSIDITDIIDDPVLQILSPYIKKKPIVVVDSIGSIK